MIQSFHKKSILSDFYWGARAWRIWWLLGIGDVRQRYSRSTLGQFWITLSQAIFIVAIGAVYSLVFKQDISTYLPYIAVNIISWNFISGMITDGSTTFIQSEGFLKQQYHPKTLLAFRVLVRNAIALAHNIILIPIVFLFERYHFSVTWFLIPIGFSIQVATGLFLIIVTGIACARFRDVPQLIQSGLQIAFFITPVMWPERAVGSGGSKIISYNPFAALLHVTSRPFLGYAPTVSDYIVSGATMVISGIFASILFARFRSRIVFWL